MVGLDVLQSVSSERKKSHELSLAYITNLDVEVKSVV